MQKLLTYILLFVSLAACQQQQPAEQETKPATPARPTYYGRNLDNMASIIAYNVYGDKVNSAAATYIAPDIVIVPFDWIKGVFKARINKLDSREAINVFGYTNFDIKQNYATLRVGKRLPNEDLAPLDTTPITTADTLYTLDYNDKKMLKTTVRLLPNNTLQPANLLPGTAIFDINGNLRAVTTSQEQFIPASVIASIPIRETHDNIYDLRLKTNKVYPSYKTFKGFRVHTTMGDFSLRLYNETPEYRDNFIRLVCDHYYDSLLVHRVLTDYLIQTGAADTKHASSDDVIGWQGPGYKLPLTIVDGIYHKRGAIAASKLPEEMNSSNSCDGGQFYVISGRKFTNDDLDKIEQEYHKKFTPAQRQTYTTIGGAPYLDGDYTVFGEITSGIDVIDKIAHVKLNGDRPINDIRITSITPIKN